MPKEGVIYCSGLKKRTEKIIRRFVAKNDDMSMSEFMDLVSHLLVDYDMTKPYRKHDLAERWYGPDRNTNEEFDALDTKMRQILESQFPERFRKLSLVKKLFGYTIRPVTRKDVEEIEIEIAAQEAAKGSTTKVAEVLSDELA